MCGGVMCGGVMCMCGGCDVYVGPAGSGSSGEWDS